MPSEEKQMTFRLEENRDCPNSTPKIIILRYFTSDGEVHATLKGSWFEMYRTLYVGNKKYNAY